MTTGGLKRGVPCPRNSSTPDRAQRNEHDIPFEHAGLTQREHDMPFEPAMTQPDGRNA